jgi:hypothetical protein
VDKHDKPEEQPRDDAESDARRAFLSKIGKAGAATPAVALLMAANFKSAQANQTYGGGCGCGGGGCGCGSGSGACGCGGGT